MSGNYGQFLESLPDAVLVVEGGERVVLANSRAAAFLGYGKDGLKGQLLAALLPEAGMKPPTGQVVRDFVNPPGTELEVSFRRRDGEICPARVSCCSVEVDGRSAVLAVIRAMPPHQVAEDELRRNEERLRQAIRVSHIGIFDHDHLTDTVYWSPEQRAYYGWGDDEPVTLAGFLERLYPDDRERIALAVQRAHDPAGDGTFDVQHRIVRRDGQIRWLDTRSRTFFEGEGDQRHPVRTVGAVLDITERKLAEDALTTFRQAIETSINAMAIMDATGRLTYLNPAFLRLWGYGSPDELLGKMPEAFIEKALAGSVLEGIKAQGRWQGEISGFRKDGTAIDVLVLASAVTGGGGELVNMMASFLDITERKRLEGQLQQAQKMESVGRLAGGVAHDFNNLLTVIRGNVTLALQDLPPSDPLHELLADVDRAAESAADVTRQLLTFSRRQMIQPRVLNLNDVITDLQKMLQRLLGEDVDLKAVLDPHLASVKLDPSQTEQILVNLAVNARDAMPGGGNLTIETANVKLDAEYCQRHPHAKPGDYVMLAVSDTGSGMSEETIAHVFEPFYTTKGHGEGTGLGLAMVYGAVKQNKGNIEVYSKLGHGTTFKMYLPMVDEVPEAVQTVSDAVLPRGTETIVLVEDEEKVRAFAVRLLKRQGYTVHAFHTGDEALGALEGMAGIHLLITDIVLPGMNGRVLAERVRALRPSVKVLFASGYTQNVIAQRGILQQGIEFIAKPYQVELLARRVREVLDKGGMPER